MTRAKVLRIGNAGGFWGDDPFALKRQVEKGDLDYISMDFLAEITMSIMQKQYNKDPKKGYAYDIVPMLEDVLLTLLKKKTKLITNAGGINPNACAEAIQELAKKIGCKVKVATVHGDNILHNVSELEAKGADFSNMETDEPFDAVRKKLESANVYFGAKAVVEALEKWDPDIIITGRVTDTGITLAAMIHEFGWEWDEWNKLASGIVAGHLIECGSQVSGGNFTDWEKVSSYDEIGFPCIEMQEDGTFTITKHEGTGGLVHIDTVREQLFYEMGDPHCYITPDVIADFSSAKLSQHSDNRVSITGVQGYEPTPFYKVSMAYSDGFKCSGSVLISGPEVRAKAEAFSKLFWKRVEHFQFEEKHTEFLGWNSCHRSLGRDDEAHEILLRFNVRAQSDRDLKIFRKMISSLILSGPPGVCVLNDSIGRIQNVISYWPALISKELVHPQIGCEKTQERIKTNSLGKEPKASSADQSAPSVQNSLESLLVKDSGKNTLYYKDLCLARSGDKGDTANLGILARSASAYEFLKKDLSAQKIKDIFQEFCQGTVHRFSLDSLHGLNFLLEQSLGGGGSKSLRADAQGKMFSQALLRQKVQVPSELYKEFSH